MQDKTETSGVHNVAAIYAYVAAPDSAKQRLAEQVKKCVIHCYEEGYHLHHIRIETGRKSEREELLQLAREGSYQILVINDLSRLTRDRAQLFQLCIALEALGIQIESVEEGAINVEHMKELIQVVFDSYSRSVLNQ